MLQYILSCICYFFFFKQKTAYEMRISDWSSDVCSSDLQHGRPGASLRGRAKKGDQDAQGLGRSRGGFTTKLHARCDGQGRPLCFVLTPGQANDVQGFGPLFRMLAERLDGLLADQGYDADAQIGRAACGGRVVRTV